MDAMGVEQKGPGRPHAIKPEQIAKLEWLAEQQYTITEIAAVFKVHRDTIRDNFSTLIQECRARGQGNIREMLYQAAQRGDGKALIHMAKHYLGQHDRQIVMTDEQLAEEAEKRLSGSANKTDT